MATPTSEPAADRLAAARTILWRELAGVAFHAAVVEGGRFAHVGTTSEYLDLLTAASEFRALYKLVPEAVWFEAGRRVTSSSGCEALAENAAPPPPSPPPRTFTVLNSLLHTAGRKGRGSVVEHSELWGAWHVGRGSLLSAVRSVPGVMVRDGIAIQVAGQAGRVWERRSQACRPGGWVGGSRPSRTSSHQGRHPPFLLSPPSLAGVARALGAAARPLRPRRARPHQGRALQAGRRHLRRALGGANGQGGCRGGGHLARHDGCRRVLAHHLDGQALPRL